MVPVSVVIITKNEAEMILHSISMAKLITDDIIIVDNSSSDDTEKIALANGCHIYHENWDGYGANKNKGIARARYNWILSIDADEVIDPQLAAALHELNYDDRHVVYDIDFKTYFGNKRIRFGSWGRDHHIRLFNRQLVKWSEMPVHETLLLPASMVKKKLPGYINHYSVKDEDECRAKAIHYAGLSARKHYIAGKKAGFIKLYLSPCFNFIRNYFLYLGLLDGKQGWIIAKNTAKHTWMKYHLLKQLAHAGKRKAYTKNRLAYSYTAD